ncbi:hypothetical protein MLD38_010605 [Melastoma candidum]|uniref:Uncharacterized protein n=1 Tax=Melastoma candidum TaxID=119954 RepID=A0ACB9R3W3_9MYRT|nr:hypothetical protein MLD38_010605 [Melastoma candidum]
MAEPSSDDLLHDFSPMLRVYKDGRIDRILGTSTLPPSFDPTSGVVSKDVSISSHPPVSARLYTPRSLLDSSPSAKLPLLVYFHGGGFCIESSSSPTYHNYLNRLVSAGNFLCVSVEYRRAPEDPLPAAFDDSWAAMKWVASHAGGSGPDEWLNCFADLRRVFLAGDSAGANIAHYVALRFGTSEELTGIEIEGAMLVHPFFWGSEPVEGEPKGPEISKFVEGLWSFICPDTSGIDDPRMNPAKDPDLGRLRCRRVIVFVAEKDGLRHRGVHYAEILRQSGWGGEVTVDEAKGCDHVFHLFDPGCDEAEEMMKTTVNFINATAAAVGNN